MLSTVLPLEDADISAELEKALKNQKIAVRTDTRVDKVDTSGGQVTLTVSKDGATETLTADKALIAIGVTPNSEGIGLESIGIETDRGFVEVDEHMQTNVPGVYAIGDVTGKLALAHVARRPPDRNAELLQDAALCLLSSRGGQRRPVRIRGPEERLRGTGGPIPLPSQRQGTGIE
jgi:dihydrolipoamide dehydrogenase